MGAPNTIKILLFSPVCTITFLHNPRVACKTIRWTTLERMIIHNPVNILPTKVNGPPQPAPLASRPLIPNLWAVHGRLQLRQPLDHPNSLIMVEWCMMMDWRNSVFVRRIDWSTVCSTFGVLLASYRFRCYCGQQTYKVFCMSKLSILFLSFLEFPCIHWTQKAQTWSFCTPGSGTIE